MNPIARPSVPPRLRAAVPRPDRSWFAPLATGLVAFLLIRATLLPTVWFWDTGEAQTVGPLLGTAHAPGFPAYTILGWLASIVLAPFGEPAFRINLLSALLVAGATAGVVVLVRRLGAHPAVAMAVGIGFAATPIVWKIGTRADVHALHVALVVLLTLLLVAWGQAAAAGRRAGRSGGGDRWLVAAAAVFGVSIANHSLTLLLVPAIVAYVLAVDRGAILRPRLVAACLLASAGTAALLYLELPLRAGPFRAPLVYAHPETWDGFWSVVLAEQFRGSIIDPFADLPRKLGDLVAFASAELGPLALLLPAGFVATIRLAPAYALYSATATAVTVFFAASYQNAEIDRYYLGPAVFAWSWLGLLAGLAVGRLAPVVDPPPAPRRFGDPWTPEADTRIGGGAPRPSGSGLLAGSLLAILAGLVLLVPTAIDLDRRWHAVDRSADRWGEAWLDDALATLEPDAVVVSTWSYSTTLWYGQLVEGRRPDIFIVDDRTRLDLELGDIPDVIDRYLETRPVYLVRVSPEEALALSPRYRLRREARPDNLFRVLGRTGAGS